MVTQTHLKRLASVATGSALLLSSLAVAQAAPFHFRSLVVSLSSTPVSQTVEAGSDDVEMVAFNLMAGDESDVRLTELNFNVYVDEDGDGDYNLGEDNGVFAQQIIDAAILMDEDGNMLSHYEAVSKFGRVSFDLDEIIEAGETERIIVVANINSASPYNGDSDKLSIDLQRPFFSMEAQNSDGRTVYPLYEATNGMDTPIVEVTVIEETRYVEDEIVVAFQGPSADDIEIGADDATMIQLTLCSATDVNVEQIAFQLKANASTTTSESAEDGSDDLINSLTATPNFTDIKLIGSDGAVLGAPQDVDVAGDDLTQTITFSDVFTIEAGNCEQVSVTLDVANNEALEDETIQITWKEHEIQTWSVENGEYVYNMTPTTDIEGNVMTLVLP